MVESVTAYIGLGGNVGDVIENMRTALRSLNANNQITMKSISHVYKTPPWGKEDQDWFLNACTSLQTSLSAQELLAVCLEAELHLKRTRNIRWGPRTIDLDILFFGGQHIAEDNLQVPHPRMHERAFVLKPMADIAPDLSLRGKTISQWLQEIETGEIRKIDKVLRLEAPLI